MQTAGADSMQTVRMVLSCSYKLVACRLLNRIFPFNNYSNTYNEQTFLIQSLENFEHSLWKTFTTIIHPYYITDCAQAFTEAVTHCTIETCTEPHKTINYDPSEHSQANHGWHSCMTTPHPPLPRVQVDFDKLVSAQSSHFGHTYRNAYLLSH